MKNKLKYFLIFTFLLFIPFNIYAYENEITRTINDYVLALVPILCLIISILIWHSYGKDEQVVETVEFYLPHDLNSLEIALLYRGKATGYDVTSLLIYLANKGYIKFIDKEIDLNQKKVNLNEEEIAKANKKIIDLQEKIELEKKNNPNSKKIKYYENMLNIYKDIDTPIDYDNYDLETVINNNFSNGNLIIKKIKEYDGNNEYEKMFMDGLFEFENETTLKHIKYSFYRTIKKILKQINKKDNRYKLQNQSSINKRYFIIFLIICSFLAVTIPPVHKYEYYNLGNVFITLFIFICFLSIVLDHILNITQTRTNRDKIFGGFATFIFAFLLWIFMIYPSLIIDSFYLIAHYIGLVCILGMVICLAFLPSTTKYGNAVLGKLRGYKEFLLTSEISKDYKEFYNILPYAYVLDMDDEWIKKYNNVNVPAPKWYVCSYKFDIREFNYLYKYLRNAMIEEPPSN